MARKTILLHFVPTVPVRRDPFCPASSPPSPAFTMTDLRVHDDRSGRSRWSEIRTIPLSILLSSGLMLNSRLLRFAVRSRIRARWTAYALAGRFSPRPQQLRCPLCLVIGERDRFGLRCAKDMFCGGKLIRYQCQHCDVVFGTEQMLALSRAEIDREYRELYSIYEEGDATDAELAAFERLEPRTGGRYLNFGCGRWSSALTKLRGKGYDIVGFEPYSANTGMVEHIITSYDRLQGMRFDGIMSNNLIEHLQNPVETFRMMRRLLNDKRSIMTHATECYRYAVEFSRFHLFFFLGRSAGVLAERAGLRVEETDSPDIRLFRIEAT